MRNVVLSLVAAGAVLAIGSPATAQYYPPQPYGYGYNGYGNNDHSEVRALHARIDRVERQIDRLDRYGAPGGITDRLREQARRIEYQIRGADFNGVNSYEVNEIQARIVQLERRVQYFSTNRYVRYGHAYNGYGGYGYDQGDRGWNGDRDDDHDQE